MSVPWLAMAILSLAGQAASAVSFDPSIYDLVWNRPSANASESMPCGGGDIGLNVWVEQGDLLFYVARSGAFDENGGLLKLGRVRLTVSPDPWTGSPVFEQRLRLADGSVCLTGGDPNRPLRMVIWVDVFAPIIHVELDSATPVTFRATYESWRWTRQSLRGLVNDSQRSFLGAPMPAVVRPDTVVFEGGGVLAFHRNDDQRPNAFDVCVEQQGLASVRDRLWNPLAQRTFGLRMAGTGLVPGERTRGRYGQTEFRGWTLRSDGPRRHHELEIVTHIAQTPTLQAWKEQLAAVAAQAPPIAQARRRTRRWWQQFWQRSFVVLDPGRPGSTLWRLGRNYQLFRYQLGCNARGDWPTKFNGGLFTVDPGFIDASRPFSPDFRRWGGSSFTAQNQRLVYWPLLKSGDGELLRPQFEFYRRLLPAAELRSEVYWGHGGACFTEQLECFGLPTGFEYGWKRPDGYDPGVEYNAWLEYHWDTALEFCWMILEARRYDPKYDIGPYLPLIESCVRFFDEHYQWLARRRGRRALDQDGHLVLYPTSACETYKMATNATPTVAALQRIVDGLLALPESLVPAAQRPLWRDLRKRIPPLSFRWRQGRRTLAPAARYERIQNVELPQLYPVFPYGLYGVGRPDLDVARATWTLGVDRPDQRNIISWHQDAIFCARLGLTKEAARLTLAKLADAERRCPTFWGPGHDWVPDHNWGGSGMIGLQEMLLQAPGDIIELLPAWPVNWDAVFKLHAPGGVVVEGQVRQGRLDWTVRPGGAARRVRVHRPHEPVAF